MIKKISVAQLRTGMFVHDLHCGWLKHPFLKNKIKIDSSAMIEKIIEIGIKDLYIDTDRGKDIVDHPPENPVLEDAVPEQVVKPVPETKDLVSVREELERAEHVKHEAARTVVEVMDDIRLGRQIEVEKVDHVVENMVDSILRNKNALISLGRIKKADEYTFMHSVSVGALMIAFGRHMGFDYELLKKIGIGGLLHDIGKVNIPAALLAKDSRLTDKEFVKIKEHVMYSRDILAKSNGVDNISFQLAVQHHERLDGSGYPAGLTGQDIGLHGQMAAIVDCYDAMTTQRCYQRQFHSTETLKKLFEWNNAYNRELVEQFIKCIGIYPVGSLVRTEGGLLGIVISHNENNLMRPVLRLIYDSRKREYIMAKDIDLSEESVHIAKFMIAGYEDPEQWNLELKRFF